jgi:hypothetical protein
VERHEAVTGDRHLDDLLRMGRATSSISTAPSVEAMKVTLDDAGRSPHPVELAGDVAASSIKTA